MKQQNTLQKIRQIHFSPAGTTRTIINRIAAAFGRKTDEIALLSTAPALTCGADSPVLVGMPVFAGRLPVLAAERLKKIKGSRTPAVAVVVYGNRAYEDALLELKDILEQNDFVVVAAAAFVAQHSLFPNLAAGRPNEKDMAALDDFARKARDKIQNSASAPVAVPGHFPYKDVSPIPLVPTADETCIRCAKCVKICPAIAIPAGNPQTTDPEKCISCTACVKICPVGARGFYTPAYARAEQMIAPKCAVYREPEVFL